MRARRRRPSIDWLMHLQADILERRVVRSHMVEIGARVVAALAFRSLGVGPARQAVAERVFVPQMPERVRLCARAAWQAAVAQARARTCPGMRMPTARARQGPPSRA